MKNIGPVLFRLGVLIALGSGAYLVYQQLAHPGQAGNLPAPLQDISVKIKGMADSLGINTDSLIEQVEEKLVKRQAIIDPDSPILGVKEQAQQIVEDKVQQVTQEIKDLPKNQAKEIVGQVCQQIISELEK